MFRLQWTVLAVVVITGTATYLVFGGVRAGVSYAAGVLVAGLVFTAGIAAVYWADRVGPAMSMMMALITYTMMVVVLAAVLAAADPDVVDAPAAAVGLVAAALSWVVAQVRATRPNTGH